MEEEAEDVFEGKEEQRSAGRAHMCCGAFASLLLETTTVTWDFRTSNWS
jgi:hypothetical protein